jgi:hypothetical protein
MFKLNLTNVHHEILEERERERERGRHYYLVGSKKEVALGINLGGS